MRTPKPCATICTQSRAKYRSTASSVPRCSAISKSSPSNCHPKSHEVRYRWAVLDIGRNSVSPWTTARTITCNKGIRSRFRKLRVPCQVRWHNAEKRHAVSRTASRDEDGPLDRVHVVGGNGGAGPRLPGPAGWLYRYRLRAGKRCAGGGRDAQIGRAHV